eukprot:5788567-Pyramimonas_sp.AAC.1
MNKNARLNARVGICVPQYVFKSPEMGPIRCGAGSPQHIAQWPNREGWSRGNRWQCSGVAVWAYPQS